MSTPTYPEPVVEIISTSSDEEVEQTNQNIQNDSNTQHTINEPEQNTQSPQNNANTQNPSSEPPEQSEHKSKQSKNEKKSRKLLMKLGLKPVPGITRITLKRSKVSSFTINNPDVFIVPGIDSYIVFGGAIGETLGQHSEAAKKFINQSGMNTTEPLSHAENESATKTEQVDTTGITEIDITTVMSQSNCTRETAIKALKQSDDVIDAILFATQA